MKVGCHQQQHQSTNQGANAHTQTHVIHSSPSVRETHQASPRAVWGDRRSVRPASCGAMVMSMSAFGKRPAPPAGHSDRKRVVLGKSVSVSVDLGGRRLIKQKKYHTKN